MELSTKTALQKFFSSSLLLEATLPDQTQNNNNNWRRNDDDGLQKVRSCYLREKDASILDRSSTHNRNPPEIRKHGQTPPCLNSFLLFRDLTTTELLNAVAGNRIGTLTRFPPELCSTSLSDLINAYSVLRVIEDGATPTRKMAAFHAIDM